MNDGSKFSATARRYIRPLDLLTMRTTPTVFLAVLCTGMAVSLMAIFARGVSYSAKYTHDVFVYYDGIDRLVAGQVPHLDFDTPAGVVSYYLPYLGYLIADGYGGAMEIAGLLLLAVALPLAAWIAAPRLGPPMATLFLAAVACAIAVPLNPGEPGHFVSNAMQYNRWGWALLSLVLVAGLPVAAARTARPWATGLAVAGLLIVLAFLKISYFAVGLAFVGLVGLADAERFRMAAVAGAGTAGGLALVWLAAPGLTTAYLEQIGAALAASGSVRGGIHNSLQENLRDIVLYGLAAFYAFAIRAARIWDLLIVLFIAVSGLVLLNQNFQTQFIVTLIAGFAYLARHVGAAPPARPDPVFVVTAAAALFLLTPALEWAHAAKHHLRTAGTAAAPPSGLPGLEDLYVSEVAPDVFRGALEGFENRPTALIQTLAERDPAQQMMQGEYLTTVRDGLDLLRASGTEGQTVLALDFLNPFPFLLDLPRRQGGYSWMHVGRNISAETAPPAEEMFRDVAFVLIPKASVARGSAEALRKLYAEGLNTFYAPVAQSEFWTLLQRRE